MTPFGQHLRALRAERGISQKQMAKAIGVSAAYLSALEHGRRGTPSYALLQRIVGFLNIIWDDAELLQNEAALSDPRVIIDTVELSLTATELANLLEQKIGRLNDKDMEQMIEALRLQQ